MSQQFLAASDLSVNPDQPIQNHFAYSNGFWYYFYAGTGTDLVYITTNNLALNHWTEYSVPGSPVIRSDATLSVTYNATMVFVDADGVFEYGMFNGDGTITWHVSFFEQVPSNSYQNIASATTTRNLQGAYSTDSVGNGVDAVGICTQSLSTLNEIDVKMNGTGTLSARAGLFVGSATSGLNFNACKPTGSEIAFSNNTVTSLPQGSTPTTVKFFFNAFTGLAGHFSMVVEIEGQARTGTPNYSLAIGPFVGNRSPYWNGTTQQWVSGGTTSSILFQEFQQGKHYNKANGPASRPDNPNDLDLNMVFQQSNATFYEFAVHRFAAQFAASGYVTVSTGFNSSDGFPLWSNWLSLHANSTNTGDWLNTWADEGNGKVYTLYWECACESNTTGHMPGIFGREITGTTLGSEEQISNTGYNPTPDCGATCQIWQTPQGLTGTVQWSNDPVTNESAPLYITRSSGSWTTPALFTSYGPSVGPSGGSASWSCFAYDSLASDYLLFSVNRTINGPIWAQVYKYTTATANLNYLNGTSPWYSFPSAAFQFSSFGSCPNYDPVYQVPYLWTNGTATPGQLYSQYVDLTPPQPGLSICSLFPDTCQPFNSKPVGQAYAPSSQLLWFIDSALIISTVLVAVGAIRRRKSRDHRQSLL